MNKVVQYYEETNEDTRLTSNNARRIEFITTSLVLDKYILQGAKILEHKVWVDYHMMTCREKSIMGISNHGLLICRKL